MPIAHLAPYYSRHPFDFQDLEYPTRTWLKAVLAELPEVWRSSSEQDVVTNLKVLLSLHQAGLLHQQEDWLEQLQSLTQRPDWQSESWLPQYLELLAVVKEAVSMPLRMVLSRHPQPEIRRWAYAQSSPRLHGISIQIFGMDLQTDDETPLMTQGLQDADTQVQKLALKYFVDCPLEPTPHSMLEQFHQLTRHPDLSVRGWALLALIMAEQPNLEPLLEQHFGQATEPEAKAQALNAWCCHQLLWPKTGITPEWHERLRAALCSDDPALLAIGAQAVGALGLTEYETALEPLFTRSELSVKTALVKAILDLESHRYAHAIFESLQTTNDISYRLLCVTTLVKLHPDFSRQHLAQVMLTEPALASRLVTELRALGWRDIPRTWLEVAAVNPPEPTPLDATEPPAPWLEI